MYGRSGVFITDISKAIKTTRTYFSIDNVFVTYLTSGDSFNFKDRTIVPEKSK